MESNQRTLKEIYKNQVVFVYEKDKSFTVGIIVDENHEFLIIDAKNKGLTSIPKSEILEIAPERKEGEKNG